MFAAAALAASWFGLQPMRRLLRIVSACASASARTIPSVSDSTASSVGPCSTWAYHGVIAGAERAYFTLRKALKPSALHSICSPWTLLLDLRRGCPLVMQQLGQ